MVDLSKANIISQAQKLKNYGAALRNATVKNKAVQAQPVQQTETTYTYTGYDSEGREVSLTEDQYNQLVKASESNTSKNTTYNVIPEEVANSGSSWYINSEGQYEWVPVTQSDKEHLARINTQRARSGLAPRTTLISGASPSDEYSQKWYSSGGGNRGVGETGVTKKSSSGEILQTYGGSTNKTPVGSGDKKIQAIKESSSVNSNASAVTGTAQDAKASIISVGVQKEQEALAEEANIRIPLKKYASKQDYLNFLAEKKTATQKAKVAASKYNPIQLSDGTNIFGIEVDSSSNLSTSGARGIISGEGYYSRSQAVADYGMKKIAAKEAAKAAKASALDISSSDISILNSNGLLGSLGLDYSKEQAAIKAAKESGVTTIGKNYIGDLTVTLESYLQKANEQLVPYSSKLPASSDIQMLLDLKPVNTLGFVSLKGKDPIGEGVEAAVLEQYEGIRTQPASKTLEYGSYYAGGAIFGAATKGVKVASGAAGKALVKPITGLAEKTGSKLVQTLGSKLVSSLESGKIVDIGLGAYLVHGSGQEIASSYSKAGLQGATKTSLDIGLALGIGAPGFKKGYDTTERVLAGDYIAAVPVVKAAKISELKGGGSSIEPVDLKYGYTIAPFDKPIISYAKSEGIKLGSIGAPESTLSTKTTQAFSKLETEFFKKTVNKNSESVESEYLESALNIGKAVSKTQKAPTPIDQLEISSKAIPEPMKPAVKEALLSYQGKLMVAGSVPMKAQTSPFTTRSAHDLEIYGDSETAIVSHITKVLESKGFKEGTDYKSSGGKIEFKLIDEKGVETYDTGIEAFTHGKESSDLIKLPTKGETDIELSSPSLKASAGKSEIAFGYNSQKPLSIEGGKLKIQTLQEQMSRKIAGSTMYKTGKLEPAHKNRIKDPLDVITMGTAFAVKDKVPIEKDLVTFTNAAFEKWGGKSKDPFSAAFNEKVASDPLVKFIHEKQRLPSETEATEFKIELAEIFQPEIFSNRAAKGSPLPVTSGSPFPSPSPRSRSPLPVTSGSPSPSPSPRSRSPSPVTFGSPSPSPSPVTFGSPSPSPSPVTFGSPSPSPSPVTSGSPSPSPNPSSRSPSTVHIMDPTPKNKKRKVDLPNSKETQKSVSIVALNGWSSRVKQHYVQDPFSLVLGGGKKRK